MFKYACLKNIDLDNLKIINAGSPEEMVKSLEKEMGFNSPSSTTIYRPHVRFV